MEDLGFDIGGIMSEEEAAEFFEQDSNNGTGKQQGTDNDEQENNADEQEGKGKPEQQAQEGVGVEEGTEDVADNQDDGSSPNVYSSMAIALKNDGIFSDLEDDELSKVETADDFAELFEKVINAKLDERQKRIDEALGNGMKVDDIKRFEQTIDWLHSVTDDALSEEGEEGEKLRRHLIYNDLRNRGYDDDKAMKKLEASFKNGDDLDDAKDALAALTKFYEDGYKKKQDDAKKAADEVRNKQKKQSEDFRKMVLDNDIKIGDTVLDKKTRERIYDAVSKPVYKDKDTGRLLTAVQKFQNDNPLEFLKQLGMWYVLTDGGKNIDALTRKQVIAEKNKSIKELGRKINTTLLNNDGSLNYVGGRNGDNIDPLMSDDWKIG